MFDSGYSNLSTPNSVLAECGQNRGFTVIEMDADQIDDAILLAASNWVEWRRDWDHSGDPTAIPILADERSCDTKNSYARYRAFLKQYGVLRGVSQDARDTLREKLCGSQRFRRALQDASGKTIDSLIREFSSLPTSNKTGRQVIGRQVAFVSKLAAFARPDTFMAFDQYAREGLALIAKQIRKEFGAKDSFDTYSKYLKAVNVVWELGLGDSIVNRATTLAPDPRIPYEDRKFGLRVLDNVLMNLGGRWKTTLGAAKVSYRKTRA